MGWPDLSLRLAFLDQFWFQPAHVKDGLFRHVPVGTPGGPEALLCTLYPGGDLMFRVIVQFVPGCQRAVFPGRP